MFFQFVLNAYAYSAICIANHEYRILMRPIQEEDRDVLNLTYGNADAMKTYMDGTARSPKEIDNRFSRYKEWSIDSNVPWVHMLAFLLPKDNPHSKEFLGSFMIEPEMQEGKCVAEISYVLRAEFWRKGFGTLCIKNFLSLTIPILQQFKIPSIVATAHPHNTGSVKLLEKNAFVCQEHPTHVRSAEASYTQEDRILYVRSIM